MLPRKIPNWVLILTWITGALPYAVIEFWPWMPLFTFTGNAKIGKFIADSSLSFSAAFPFWFVIEYIGRRNRKAEIARIQRRLINRLISTFEGLWDSFEKHGARRTQFDDGWRPNWDILYYELKKRFVYYHTDTVPVDVATAFDQCAFRLSNVNEEVYHYQSHFSVEFNHHLEGLFNGYPLFLDSVKSRSDKGRAYLECALKFWNDLVELERSYCKEYKQKPSVRKSASIADAISDFTKESW